jgi:hypothetical protein
MVAGLGRVAGASAVEPRSAVAVSFVGNMKVVGCLPAELSRTWPPCGAPSEPDPSEAAGPPLTSAKLLTPSASPGSQSLASSSPKGMRGGAAGDKPWRSGMAAAAPVPGGFAAGERVFWRGASHDFPSGDSTVYGRAGVIEGGAGADCVAVRFYVMLFAMLCHAMLCYAMLHVC